ncbi:MAG: hypothetical protein M3220_14950 [Chloroflexota bacterium]|nr:hypothetical protein [Chloroflexota bacterium]
MNVIRLWWLSLAIAATVIGVVAALLWRIVAAAESVDRHAAQIWVEGKKIAGNTVSIWMLEQTNERVSRMVEVAESLERIAASIDEKLQAAAGSSGERS